MNHSTPGLPVYQQLPEFTQTHVHRVSDAIQPSYSLLFPSPPALNLSQHQGLFKWVSSSHRLAKVLEFQLQHQSFQWTPRTDFLQDGLVGSPCSPRDSQESSPTPQFKSINSSTLSFLYSPTLTSIHDHWKNHSLEQMDLCWQSNVSVLGVLPFISSISSPSTVKRIILRQVLDISLQNDSPRIFCFLYIIFFVVKKNKNFNFILELF